jgi:outer membrane lipoprotein-sorting protein
MEYEKKVNKMKYKKILLVAILLLCFQSTLMAQDASTAKELIRQVEDLMRSDEVITEISMEIVTPDWRRTLVFKSYDDRQGDQSFIHILEPVRDRNTTFLRQQRQLWSYLPQAERTLKIPPSMMMQSWMGSDFTNDDLVKESSLVSDYEHEYNGTVEEDGNTYHQVTLIPKPDAPVTWGKIEALLRENPLTPYTYRYFDRRGELRKTMVLDQLGTISGRTLPTRWTMTTTNKPGHKTIITLESIEFDPQIPARIFTRQFLRNPR